MKKKTAAIVAAAIMAATCFACAKGNENETKPAPASMTDVINAYETLTDFDTMQLQGSLGKIEKNTETAYVKNGNSSAKVTVLADPYIGGKPTIYQSLTQEKTERYFDDFGQTAALRLQVYNANAGARLLQMELVGTGGGRNSKFFELQSGWNDVVYDVKREYLSEYYDTATGESKLAVRGINLKFDRPARDADDDVYYFDDFIRQRTKKGYSPVAMNLERDEIASFDDDWQVSLAKTRGFWRDNYSGRLSQETSGGRTYARIDCPAGTDGGDSWGCWAVNEEQTALVPWDAYRTRSRLLFDYCIPETNPMQSAIFCLICIGEDKDGNTKEYPIFERRIDFSEPGVWKTFSVTVAEINAYVDYRKADKTFADINRVQFTWAEFGGQNRTYYIDNIRMIY